MDYEDFLKAKEEILHSFGHDCKSDLSFLFDFQKELVKWATKKGRCALFADCGLGKTAMQLKWAESVFIETQRPVLILAPLSVSRQTHEESKKFNVETMIVSKQEEVFLGINITNYEKLHHFDCSVFGGVVLDESSILKSFTSSTRNQLISAFSKTDYRLACTATPAPNDFMEIGNHAEFLGIMTRTEMLSMYFINDMKETQKWRLKKHAQKGFWAWMSSWSIMIKKPSDVGFSDDGFELPPLNFYHHIIDFGQACAGNLFKDVAHTLSDQRKARKESIPDRLLKINDIINDEQWIVWCDLNDESESIAGLGFSEVRGSNTPEQKETILMGFAEGNVKKLVSKSSIAGFGMNFQSCHNMIFFGLSHSYESFYQSVRRCWRFGQKHQVNCHIIITDIELPIIENIERKHSDAEEMQRQMVENMIDFTKAEIKKTEKKISEYNANKKIKLPKFLKG